MTSLIEPSETAGLLSRDEALSVGFESCSSGRVALDCVKL
jgi:hypothetical protein